MESCTSLSDVEQQCVTDLRTLPSVQRIVLIESIRRLAVEQAATLPVNVIPIRRNTE